MSPARACSFLCAAVAAIVSWPMVYWFHFFGMESHPAELASAFSLVAAGLAEFWVWVALSWRIRTAKIPAFGGWVGAGLAILVFLCGVMIHTIAFPGHGGFFSSIFPILAIGLILFGWAIALIGAALGALCQRIFLRNRLSPLPGDDDPLRS